MRMELQFFLKQTSAPDRLVVFMNKLVFKIQIPSTKVLE